MFVGHYSVSFAAKSVDRRVPLWALFVAVQLLDVLWAPLILIGVEKVRIVPGITATNPLDLYFMPYTHSLIAAVLWSLAVFLAYRVFTNDPRSAAVMVALAVFSHWLLDLVVHRPDLPLYDDTWKVGLGLWNRPVLALATEAALVAIGVAVYLRTATSARHIWTTIGFAIVMFGVHCITFFGAPPSSPAAAATMALVAYLVFAAGARSVDRP
jgi:membrane-bound metal-dependent hydrolase YbcI (DUF457 family)